MVLVQASAMSCYAMTNSYLPASKKRIFSSEGSLSDWTTLLQFYCNEMLWVSWETNYCWVIIPLNQVLYIHAHSFLRSQRLYAIMRKEPSISQDYTYRMQQYYNQVLYISPQPVGINPALFTAKLYVPTSHCYSPKYMSKYCCLYSRNPYGEKYLYK